MTKTASTFANEVPDSKGMRGPTFVVTSFANNHGTEKVQWNIAIAR